MLRYRLRSLAWAGAVVLFFGCNNGKPSVGVTTPNAGPPPPQAPAGPDLFEDVTARTGIQFAYENGEKPMHYAILESLGGGGAAIDFDRDGLLDLFFPGGGYYEGPDGETLRKQRDEYVEKKKRDPNAVPPTPPKIHGRPGKLFRNLGNWKFEDVTAKAGLENQPDIYTHGCAVADYDRDGWPDLLVTGYGRVTLYHNEAGGMGSRKFVDVTEKAGLLGDHFWSTSAAWGDFDGDGNPDLYLCQYVNWSWANDPPCPGYTTRIPRDVCPPKQFDSVPHVLFRNQGNGTFEDVTKSAGLRVAPREDKDYGKGLGVLLLDADGDGKLDIYVANDTTDNFLYLNRSTPGKMNFEDKGLALGVAKDLGGIPNGSMGIWAADFEGSGRPSIWVTNYENEYHALYRSMLVKDRVTFTFHTPAAGLTAIGSNYVGFGTAFVDPDLDGWEDIVISNGHVIHHPPRNNLKQKPILFLNRPHEGSPGISRRFQEASARGGSYFAGEHRGRGLIVADFDNDGITDLVFTHVNDPVAVLRGLPGENHWLGIDLVPKQNRSPVGAKLTLEVGDRKLTRFVLGGGSYLCAHDLRKVFGLGSATKVGKLTVDWPGGASQSWDGLELGKYHKLEQQ